jgi:hypothetical protein
VESNGTKERARVIDMTAFGYVRRPDLPCKRFKHYVRLAQTVILGLRVIIVIAQVKHLIDSDASDHYSYMCMPCGSTPSLDCLCLYFERQTIVVEIDFLRQLLVDQ